LAKLSKAEKRALRKKQKLLSSINAPQVFADAEVPNFKKTEKLKHPFFSHRYITTGAYCVKRCRIEQFRSFADKLRILSSLDWPTIESSPRETNGFELLPSSALKEKLPAPFEKEDKAMVFRFGGNAGRIVGVRDSQDMFFILFIDHDFTLYDHG
jgi:hypothetical protein